MATFAASRTKEREVSVATGGSKAWAWTGIATALAGIIVTWSVQFAVGVDALESGGEPILDKLNKDNVNLLYRLTSGFGYLTVAGLLFFAAGFWKHMQAKTRGESILPTVMLGSIVISAATLAMAMAFRAQVMDGLSYYANDPSTHVMMDRLQQDSVLAGWATLIGASVAATIGGLKGNLFPKSVGWFSLVMTLFMVAFCMGGVPFPANIPALIWLLVIASWSVRQPSVD